MGTAHGTDRKRTPLDDVSGVLSSAAARAIDTLMDRASQKLAAADYFGAQEICLRALEKARRACDWERVSRIILPLQESRRQIRQMALDAADGCVVVSKMPTASDALAPGLYIVEPPLVGIQARGVREALRGKKIPAMVLAKEPTTSAGLWPVVGAGEGKFEVVVARVRVEPPPAMRGHQGRSLGAHGSRVPIDAAWFVSAQEALGDAAIAKVHAEWPAAHRVEDLIELLDAVPDHEKLAQALGGAAREAVTAPPPAMPRRRPWREDLYSF